MYVPANAYCLLPKARSSMSVPNGSSWPYLVA